MKRVIGVLVGAAVLAGCVFKQSTDVDVSQGQGITGATPASPSPDPQCTVRTADLGTEGDATTAKAGGEPVRLVLSLFGPQGLELTESCLATVQPTFTREGPCVLEGSGFAVALRAPTGTPAGATCSARARAGGVESGAVALTVVP